MNWMIDGVKKLLNNHGRINRTAEHLERIDGLLMESSSVDAFVEKCLEEDVTSSITVETLLTEYQKYCREMDWMPQQDMTALRKMKQAIQAKYHIAQSRDIINRYGFQVRGYAGLCFKDCKKTDPMVR